MIPEASVPLVFGGFRFSCMCCCVVPDRQYEVFLWSHFHGWFQSYLAESVINFVCFCLLMVSEVSYAMRLVAAVAKSVTAHIVSHGLDQLDVMGVE